MKEILNARAKKVAMELLELADDLNLAAAQHRKEQRFSDAEDADRVAESLRAAKTIVDHRGMLA